MSRDVQSHTAGHGRRVSRRAAVAAAVTATALLGSACASEEPAAPGADEKVELQWWLATGDPETQAAVSVAFTALTGHTVEVFQDTNGPLVQKLYASYQRDESPDVVFITNPADIVALSEAGMLLEYTPGPVETDYPEELKNYAPYAYPYALITYGFAYNTNAVPPSADILAEFSDLFDPAYRGEFGMPDPSTVGGAVSALFALRENLGEAAYADLLEGLAELEPKFYPSNYPLGNALASGELSVGLIFDQAAEAQVRLGAPVAFSYPAGAPASYGLAAIPANAPHPEQAKQFLDFFTSLEGQQLWSNTYGDTPANPLAVPEIQKTMTRQDWYRQPGEFAYLTQSPTPEQQAGIVEQFTQIVKGG
jgi:iron(III) transport system substrate-binding protein